MKCVLVGDQTVGKTSLILAQVTGKNRHEYIPTIYERPNHQEPDTSIEVDGRNVDLYLWDTVNDYHDYDRLRPLSYPNTDVFLICFSLGRRKSYEDVYSLWYPEVKRYCPHTPIVLVGLKQDVRNEIPLRGIRRDSERQRASSYVMILVHCNTLSVLRAKTKAYWRCSKLLLELDLIIIVVDFIVVGAKSDANYNTGWIFF